MNGFSLPRNFIEDLEKLLRKKKFVEARDKFESQSRTPLLLKLVLQRSQLQHWKRNLMNK